MTEVNATLQRILLPLDVSRDSLTAMEIALELAAALDGQVSGLFIEDVRLLVAASLPFACEVGSLSGVARRIESADIEHRFRALAEKARSTLAERASRGKVPSSFHVTRGDVTAEILTAASEADMVVLGKAGWKPGSRRKPGATCLSILARSRVPVLVVESGAKISSPMLVVDDGTAAGERAVAVASIISRSLGWKLAVLELRGAPSSDAVFDSVRANRPRLFVLPGSLPLSEYAAQLKCPILFVP